MLRRTSARVSARQPPRDRIRSSMRREAAFPVARFASAPGLAFAPAFGGDLDLVADLRGLLARDVPLSRLRPLLFGFSATVHSPTRCDAQRTGCSAAGAAGCNVLLDPHLGHRLWHVGHDRVRLLTESAATHHRSETAEELAESTLPSSRTESTCNH